MSIGPKDPSKMSQDGFFQDVFSIERSMSVDRLPTTPSQLCNDIPINSHISSDFSQVSRSSGFSFDIISACSYPVPEPANLEEGPAEGENRQVLYGGLSISDGEQRTRDLGIVQSKVDNRSIQSNKRLKKGAPAAADNTSKKRGRPRLNTKDETATERRRTQIRLAQRAYRLRKETTISTLNKRVTELEQTIKEMSKSFLAFNDQIMNSGLLAAQPELLQHLRCTTERFLSLANQAAPGSDCKSTTRDRTELEERPRLVEEEKYYTRTRESQHTTHANPLGYVFARDDTSLSETNWASYMSTSILDPHKIYASFQGTGSMILDESHDSGVFTHETIRTDLQYQPNIELPLLPRAPYTYSYQETTFARRLHRACLERAYSLLTSPLSDPEEVFRVFRFAFCVSNRKRMIPRFQKLLKRGADEALEFWSTPLFHIGGAGTHYPRKDQQGHPIYPPNIHPAVKAFGPIPFHLAETPHGKKSVDSLLAAIGFDGEWFDPNDVEGFLQEKGIFLDGHSSVVELSQEHIASLRSKGQQSPVMINSDASQATRGSAEISVSHDAPIAVAKQQTGTSFVPPGLDKAQPTVQLLHEDEHLSGRLGLPKPEQTTSVNLRTHTGSQVRKSSHERSSLMMDVARFLDRLMSKGVCLGRAPGFRRRDVEDALDFAIQEAL